MSTEGTPRQLAGGDERGRGGGTLAGRRDGDPGAPAPLVGSVEVTIDAVDADRAVAFWRAALDYEEQYRRGAFVVLCPAGGRLGPTVLIQRLQEGAVTPGARATHLDLRSADRVALVARLLGLGARAVREVEDEGRSWVVMEDPEGVRFCVCDARGTPGPAEP